MGRVRDERAKAARHARKALDSIEPSNCHPQTQSPLFSVLPAELRNMIFTYAVSAYDDKSWPLPGDGLHIKPGRMWESRVSTELCRTCRLIYYETSSIPLRSIIVRVSNMRLQVLPQRRPKMHFESKDIACFTAKNSADLWHVHCTSFWHECSALKPFTPKILSISLQSSDPFGFEIDTWQAFQGHHTGQAYCPLDLAAVATGRNKNRQLVGTSSYPSQGLPDSLQEFRVQMDVLDQRRDDLVTFFRDIGPQFIATKDKSILSTIGIPITFETWWVFSDRLTQQEISARQATDPRFKWVKMCQATLTYRRNMDFPQVEVWSEREAGLDPAIVSHLDSAVLDGHHIVETSPRKTEGQKACSFRSWLLARAKLDGIDPELLSSKLPPPKDL